MAYWEYLVENIPVDLKHDVSTYQNQLDVIGSDGWELVHVHPAVDKVVALGTFDASIPHAAHVFKRKL
jgi:hypothetical protein